MNVDDSLSIDFEQTGPRSITPTRKLTIKERRIFDKIRSEFVHLMPSDAEQLSQYSEAVARYQTAMQETKKHPTIAAPMVNRSTGNVIGEKQIRNPAFATLREAQAQVNTLARRLLIDASSADKRQRLLTKKARALAAAELKSANDQSIEDTFSEVEIQAEIKRLSAIYIHATPQVLRVEALWHLTYRWESANDTTDYSGLYVG